MGCHIVDNATYERPLEAGASESRPHSNLCICGLDALGIALAAASAICRSCAATFTVYCDPLLRSCEPIRLHNRRGPFAFRIESAPSERERRIVSWFYRWHDTPEISDWIACMARFGLASPPDHTIRLYTPTGMTSDRVIVAIDVVDGMRTLSYIGADTTQAHPRGRITLGGLLPERLIRDAMAPADAVQ
jgi:hypothetical protein